MAELMVENVSGADVVLNHEDGSSLSIPAADPGPQQAVAEKWLLSTSFAQALADGKLTFIENTDPLTAEQQTLGVSVFRALTSRLTPKVFGQASSMQTAITGLAKKRDQYNSSWTQTKALIEAANVSAPGAQALADAAGILLTTEVEQALVDDLEAQIVSLDASITGGGGAPTPEELAAYNAARNALEAQLAAAEAALEKAQAGLDSEFSALSTQLDEAAQVMTDTAPGDIGSQVSW